MANVFVAPVGKLDLPLGTPRSPEPDGAPEPDGTHVCYALCSGVIAPALS